MSNLIQLADDWEFKQNKAYKAYKQQYNKKAVIIELIKKEDDSESETLKTLRRQMKLNDIKRKELDETIKHERQRRANNVRKL